MCLSVCPPVWNKSTSLDFLEILCCGVVVMVVVDINSVKAIRVCLKIGQN
jgi:hypothetical protein